MKNNRFGDMQFFFARISAHLIHFFEIYSLDEHQKIMQRYILHKKNVSRRLEKSITNSIEINEFQDLKNELNNSSIIYSFCFGDYKIIPILLAQMGYSAQSLILYQCEDYYIRCNIWPSESQNEQVRMWQNEMFSYLSCHDHNFDFLTVGCYGPGYKTKIWEYDYEKVVGYIGERVDMRFLETTYLTKGKAMIFRASKDIHTQYVPESLTISLNLIPQSLKIITNNQFYFDSEKMEIESLVPTASTGRNFIFKLASQFYDDDTIKLLQRLSEGHDQLPVTKIEAFKTLELLLNDKNVWNKALNDKTISKYAEFKKST